MEAPSWGSSLNPSARARITTMTTMRDQQNGKTNKAIPLILENEGRYEVSEEATKLLDDLPAPLAVVSIAGLWRTGKSYLLNQLSGATCDNDKTGFQVGASVNACTKGLWLWGEPVRLPDGLTVLFIDTEGLGSTSRTQTEDSQIFSLALLLSSLFVWNSRGVIDGNALEDFALVVNLTKHIHVRSEAAKKALEAHDAKTSEKHFVHSGGGLSAGASAGASAEVTCSSIAPIVRSRRRLSCSDVPRPSRRGMRSAASYTSVPMVGMRSTRRHAPARTSPSNWLRPHPA